MKRLFLLFILMSIVSVACVQSVSSDEVQYATYVPLATPEVIYGVNYALQSGLGSNILILENSVVFMWPSETGTVYNFSLMTLNATGVSNLQGVLEMIRNGQSTRNLTQGSEFIRMLEVAGFRHITPADLPATIGGIVKTYVGQLAMQGQIIWSNTWPTFMVVPAGIFDSAYDAVEDVYGFSIEPIQG